MSEGLIDQQDEFEKLCDQMRSAGIVAFDSEFISEHTYRPELCLLQFSFGDQTVAVDPLELQDLSSWWKIMADDATTVIVHGGQAEIRFCLTEFQQPPRRLVDIQLAEGLQSRSYPLGYGALVQRIVGKRVSGKETRTDWRRRPLSSQQIYYAKEDVRHVIPIWTKQQQSLSDLGRLEWADVEFQRLVDEITAEDPQERWRRISGVHKLNQTELAVLIKLTQWREAEAEKQNRPLRRILRDDLLIELARRQPSTPNELTATRDMNRGDLRRAAPAILESIQQGQNTPKEEVPTIPRKKNDSGQDEHVLGQLLSLALANLCAESNVSRQLVGTNADLRQLVRWHTKTDTNAKPPRLTTGWRATVCGDLLTNILEGRTSLRVTDPQSDHPLSFETTSIETT